MHFTRVSRTAARRRSQRKSKIENARFSEPARLIDEFKGAGVAVNGAAAGVHIMRRPAAEVETHQLTREVKESRLLFRLKQPHEVDPCMYCSNPTVTPVFICIVGSRTLVAEKTRSFAACSILTASLTIRASPYELMLPNF